VRPHSNFTVYKKRLIKIWNEVAPRYHRKWAKENKGPFQSTVKIIAAAKLQRGYSVLDLACGTGAVTKKILFRVGKDGYVVGVDSALSAIKIAKRGIIGKNVDFVTSDVESLHFNKEFDAVTCQYALFFFPNAQKALQNAKHCLKKGGTLTLAVHGAGNTVPYFSSILDVVTEFIPDYIPPGAPDLDRYGTKTKLKRAITDAGFTKIKIDEYLFSYSPGSFSKYWNDYLKYLAKPLRKKINKLSTLQRNQMRSQIRQKTIRYTKNGKIVFPWKVLILTATKP
jgi:ubiquinone/menaquinone biosynthesis C-methylase UbiE